MLAVSRLGPDEAAAYTPLAFPRYRHGLLDLGPHGRTVAVGADVLGDPWGLALAQVTDAHLGLLRSVVVIERARRRGLASWMLLELEAALRARGVQRLVAFYRGDRPHSEAVAGLLARCGFEHSSDRSVLELRYRVARAIESPALNLPCAGAEVVPFTAARFEALLSLDEASGMAPANVPPDANDPALAILVALRGEMAACMLGFRADTETAHVTLLFVRREFRRARLATFATRAFLLRLMELGLVNLSCEVRLNNLASLSFVDGKLAPMIESRAIVHGAHKAF